eukprot:1186093-Prorocentrum_minimum.AAC.2
MGQQPKTSDGVTAYPSGSRLPIAHPLIFLNPKTLKGGLKQAPESTAKKAFDFNSTVNLNSTVDTSIPFSARRFEYFIEYSTYIPCRQTATWLKGASHPPWQGTLSQSTMLKFDEQAFPGYTHRRTLGFKDGMSKGENQEIAGQARTYVFERVVGRQHDKHKGRASAIGEELNWGGGRGDSPVVIRYSIKRLLLERLLERLQCGQFITWGMCDSPTHKYN